MSNRAAMITAAKSPLEVREVETYTPGPNELLVRNEVIAFNPVEYKIAKLGIIPLQYPSILGSTFGGRIEIVGSNVKNFKVDDRVVASKKFGVVGNQYGSHQRYVVAQDTLISKIPAEIDLAIPASILMNLSCVVGLFSGRLGLDKPIIGGSVPAKESNILIYGGSSSFGSLSIQYLSQAGYKVCTTSSPRNHDFVSKLGATTVVDHTQKADKMVEEIVALGPYDVVVDMISTSNTISTTAKVLEAQGGGNLYAMEPAFRPETLPNGVKRVFEPWSDPLYEEKDDGLLKWLTEMYLPEGLQKGAIVPVSVEKVRGGLEGVNEALDRMQKGVSGIRLVADPWE